MFLCSVQILMWFLAMYVVRVQKLYLFLIKNVIVSKKCMCFYDCCMEEGRKCEQVRIFCMIFWEKCLFAWKWAQKKGKRDKTLQKQHQKWEIATFAKVIYYMRLDKIFTKKGAFSRLYWDMYSKKTSKNSGFRKKVKKGGENMRILYEKCMGLTNRFT